MTVPYPDPDYAAMSPPTGARLTLGEIRAMIPERKKAMTSVERDRYDRRLAELLHVYEAKLVAVGVRMAELFIRNSFGSRRDREQTAEILDKTHPDLAAKVRSLGPRKRRSKRPKGGDE